MVFTEYQDKKILEAVHRAAESIDYGEVRVKIDKTAPKFEIIIETQEKLRFDIKTA